MKKILLILFSIAICNYSFAVDFTYKVTTGQNLRFTVLSESDKTCAVSSNQPRCTGALSIPSKAICLNKSYDVIEIKKEAFSGMKRLTSVFIPTSIKEIGYRAFFKCTGITVLSVPSSVEKIELDAFYNVPYISYEGKASGSPWGAKQLLSKNYNKPSTPSRNSVPQNKTTSHDESWYRNYFRENIEELDPIEGLYSVVTKVTYRHGASESYDFNGEVGVIRKNDKLIIVHISGDDVCNDTELERIGETNVYNMIKYWNGCTETSTGRIYLNNIFSFECQYDAPSCFVRLLERARVGNERYAAYAKFQTQCSFIKEYPTRSMYENAIANAQKRIEEESQPTEWSGTGWALGNGYFVTNHHVTDGARIINVKGVDGNLNTGYSAEVVAADKVNDIAILKITDRRFVGFGARPYGVTTRMADVGEDVFVLGYPLTQALGNEIKLTNGIISSRTGYQGDVACYQMSAPVQPGNSGGPMFDSKGNVIGIVVAGVPGAENVGYAIKTSYLKILIESAGLNITFPTNNTISTLSLAEKVKRVKNFVFYIECSK